MKKFVLLCLSACLICVNISGYVPMLNNGKKWTYLKTGIKGDPRQYMTFNYGIIGDTIVNGIKYYKSDFQNQCFKSDFLLREDTIEQKVYFYHIGLGCEYLLYDFDVNAGDTIDVFADGSPVYYEPMDSADYHKVYITSVEFTTDIIGNRIKKVNYMVQYDETDDGVKSYYEDSYLEGYGSMKFILPFYNSFKTWSPNPSAATLRCSIDSDEVVTYKNNEEFIRKYLGEDCEGSGVMAAVDNTKLNYVTLAYSDETICFSEEVSCVSIVSVDGRIVYSDINNAISTLRIKLSAGIYFVRFSIDGKQNIQKFAVR